MLVALLLAVAPLEGTHDFVFSLEGAPVGTVQLEVSADRYVYRSRHFYRRGAKAVVTHEVPRGEAAQWLSFSMLRPLPLGCRKVKDEGPAREGELCVTEVLNEQVHGTMFGEQFSATYSRGLLQRLVSGLSRFERGAPLRQANPFESGFELPRGSGGLRLTPALAGARIPELAPRPTAVEVNEGQCLEDARQWLKTHAGYERVLGLVVDGSRVFPHAWVRKSDGSDEVDPSARGESTRREDYLALPADAAALVYLELLSGKRKLSRASAK